MRRRRGRSGDDAADQPTSVAHGRSEIRKKQNRCRSMSSRAVRANAKRTSYSLLLHANIAFSDQLNTIPCH